MSLKELYDTYGPELLILHGELTETYFSIYNELSGWGE